MKLGHFAAVLAIFLAACAAEDPMTRPDTYIPPDPNSQRVAYIEVKRDFGVLGGLTLFTIDAKQVINPAYVAEERRAPEYQRAIRTQAWSNDTETLFLAVPVGEHRLSYLYLPGMSIRDFNPFDPGDTLLLASMNAHLQPGRMYRAHGEEAGSRHSYRFWLQDIRTGETIASSFVQ